MTTILVVDDDPLIADIIQALDPSWHVLSARDGLMGLDILRKRVPEGHLPDLIILDIHMPLFDGYDTCILIRALSSTVPIVPFTQVRDDDRLPRYMQELHCSPPVQKGMKLDALLQHLRAAMQSAPVSAQTTTAVFERLLEKAREAEQQARTPRSSRILIALFAQSVVQRLGMKQVLETISDPPLHITPIDSRTEDITQFVSESPILVASTSDIQAVLELHQRHYWPLLLIADTLQEGVTAARMVHERSSPMAVGIVLADHTLMGQLSHALRVLAKGRPYAEPLLRYENARQISTYCAERRLLPELSARLTQLVVLDFLGWTTASICDHLQVMPLTIDTYWSRVAERLGRNREEVRLWVKHSIERQAVLDQLRDYLKSTEQDSHAMSRRLC